MTDWPQREGNQRLLMLCNLYECHIGSRRLKNMNMRGKWDIFWKKERKTHTEFWKIKNTLSVPRLVTHAFNSSTLGCRVSEVWAQPGQSSDLARSCLRIKTKGRGSCSVRRPWWVQSLILQKQTETESNATVCSDAAEEMLRCCPRWGQRDEEPQKKKGSLLAHRMGSES